MNSTKGLTDIVFLPGLTCDGEILFSSQIAKFKEIGHNVIVIDNTKAQTNQELVQQIIEQVKEPSHFVGLSAGGYALLELLKVKPELVDKMALVSTQAREDSAEKKESRNKMIDQVERGQYKAICNQLFDLMAAEQHLDDAELKSSFKAMAEKVTPQGFINQMKQILTKSEFLSFLPKIEKETLIIIGQDDRMFPPALSREMNDKIKNSNLSIIPDCGHLSTMEQPEAVTVELVNFFSRNIQRSKKAGEIGL